VYTKSVTGKVAYFKNVFSDWSIFKEAVLLSNQRFPHCDSHHKKKGNT
jgi:hypothetical protein